MPLKEPLRFAAPAGTRVINDNDLNLFTIGGDCDDMALETLPPSQPEVKKP